MANDLQPSHYDIEYLHAEFRKAGLPPPTEEQEDAFIEQCGKNWNDCGDDDKARREAFELLYATKCRNKKACK